MEQLDGIRYTEIPQWISELIQTFYSMFMATDRADYIDLAITLAMNFAQGDPSYQVSVLEPLFWHLRKFMPGFVGLRQVSRMFPEGNEQLGGIADLDKAIEKQQEEEQQEELAGLEEAIEEVLAATQVDHPHRARMMSKLGLYLGDRYEQLGALEDLEKAIERLQEALAATPADHSDRTRMMCNLGIYLAYRYERLGAWEDLEMAIRLGQEAVAATPLGHPDRAGVLNNLGNQLGNRYERFGALEDLEMAIELGQEALAATPVDHPHRERSLSNLGIHLAYRYKRLGALMDLEKAIERFQEALAGTPFNHPSRMGMLGNLGIHLAYRYERLGALDDLEKAIQRLQEALTGTPFNHPNRAGMLGNLCLYLGDRYERLGVLEDLEKAIERGQEAVAATPVDHPERERWLNNLGLRLGDRYRRLGALEDLEKAIELGQEALAATPVDHPHRERSLSNLGLYLGDRYERLGAFDDLEKAIERLQEAVAATPVDHPDRAARLNNLGCQLGSRYERLGALDDLEKAIERLQEAVAATPVDHPDRADWLSNLGRYLLERRPLTIQTLGLAFWVYKQAWDCITSPPLHRIRAARKASYILLIQKKWLESSSLLEAAIKTLPLVCLRHLRQDDLQFALSDLTQLASVAVSAALEAGETASHCVGTLELGRGIIMGLSIDSRSTGNLLKLQRGHPGVYDKFNLLRSRIDSSIQYDSGGSTPHDSRAQRLKDIQEFEQTTTLIRGLPGFEEFLLPPSAENLIAIARAGPIIILNCNQWRSDAIIVSNSAVKVLPLPRLAFEDVLSQMGPVGQLRGKLIRGKSRTYPSRNEGMEKFLLWLWDMAVEPIFEELQLHNVSANLPRVWWIGVGAMSMAPFHAAGDHSPGSTRNTLSRAISSYIPTIKALSYAREKQVELGDSSLLLISMSETPNHSALSSACDEVGMIASVVPEETTTEYLPSPTVAVTLAKIPSHDVVHFTCHGVSDGLDPSNSHLLLLKDGSESGPGKVDKLTAGAISSINLQRAQIAYLSACSTAQNASDKLADESIHIASAFQLAGFSHVLANMWKSNDKACQEVSSEFYRLLFDGEHLEGDNDGHRKVSTSFHKAVKKLRDENWKQPLLWAPFIHTGA